MANENVHIELTANADQAIAAVKKLQAEILALQKLALGFTSSMKKMTTGLNVGGRTGDGPSMGQDAAMRGLRQRWTFETRMNRQRLAEERAVGAEQARQDRARSVAEDAAMRQFRERMAFQGRMLRQQANMERDAERARASAIRETARETRAAERRNADVRRDVSRGFSKAGDVSGRVVDAARSVSLLGTLGAGALAKIGSMGLEARSRIDTAEANLRMFGGKSRDEVNATRSGWLNRSAVEFGFRPADALNAFTEVLKAGIPQIAARDVTKSIMGASAGLDLDVPETTKLVGRLSTLTQDPKAFSAGAIDKMLNGIAVVAKVTAVDSKEIVSSLRRGAGVLGASKMSVQDLTAFTGVGISAGMQEGKAGTFMDFLVNDMVNAKTARGQRGKDLSEGFRLLGLGSNASISTQTARDPTAVLLKMFEKMARMSPERAARAANLIGMREWRGEMLQMMKAAPMLRQTVEAERDPKNAGHLKQAQDERLGTLAGLRRQLAATFDLAWEAVGGGIEDIVREIGTFFIDLGKMTDFDVIKAHVHTLIDGFVDGLGFKSVTEMLQSAFGKPGSLDYSTLKSFFEFAQGFGRGVREVIDTIKSIVSSFSGSNMDANAFGNLSAKIMGLSFTLVAIAPYVAVLGGLATALGGFAVTIGTIATSLRAAGLLGGAGATAGGFLGAGAMATAGGLLGAAFLAAVADKLGILKAPDMSKGSGRGIVEFLDPGLASRLYGDGKGEAKGDAPARIQRQSLDVETTGSIAALIRKSSYGYDDRDDETRRVASGIDDLRAILHKATLTNGGVGSAVSSSMGGGVGGGSGGDGAGSGSGRFFTPPDMQVPGWYGQGKGAPGSAGGGSASSNPANSAASAAMLDAIAGTEGGRAGYEAVLGNGRYGTPSKPITSMSLDEAFAFGRTIKARHGSSSALGRYQIVGNTMRAAQRALGIGGDAKFDGPMQDRMARWVARSQGLGAWEGLKGNPRAMATARAAMAAGGAKDAPVGSLASTDPHIGINVPGLGLGKGQYEGLRLKGGQAVGGGASALGITDLARQAQENLPGGVKHFSAFNDRYHAGTGSKHASGLAFDTTLNDAGLSAQAAQAMRKKMKASGLDESQFKVIDEYLNPSSRSTGGHIHTQFNSKEAAKRYHDYIAGLEGDSKRAVASVNGIGETARKAQNGDDARFRPQGRIDLGSGMTGTPFAPKPSTDEIVGNMPSGIGRNGGGSGGGNGAKSITITQHISGGNQSPTEIANLAQRKITEDWNHRSHDLEPELT